MLQPAQIILRQYTALTIIKYRTLNAKDSTKFTSSEGFGILYYVLNSGFSLGNC